MSRLTPAQRNLVDGPSNVYVEACPGAGKTRALVARFLRKTQILQRQGIALISFTNAAIDEVKDRCTLSPEALKVPNYVGTFDSFINRFLVGPIWASKYGKYPVFLETWDALNVTFIRPERSKHYLQYSLECFDIDILNKSALLNPDRVSGDYAKALIKVYESNKPLINDMAWNTWLQRLKKGYISSSASRILVTHYLGQSTIRKVIKETIGARFQEVIVDEAQDCGAEELAILSALREAGIELTLVCDPDQAIFEFRRATPDQLKLFAHELAIGEPMFSNFRSTKAICKLNSSLRHGDGADVATGENAVSDLPIMIVPYEDIDDVYTKVTDLVNEYSLGIGDGIVLSHKTQDAYRASGAREKASSSANRALAFACSWKVLTNLHSDTRDRKVAIQTAERAFLSLVADEQTCAGHHERACEYLGLNPRSVREFVIRLCMEADPVRMTATEYASDLRRRVASFDWGNSIKAPDLSAKLRAAKSDDWSALNKQVQSCPLRAATIHSAKGREYEWIVLVLPPKARLDENGLTAIDHWQNGLDSESRRVLYVGASRAKKAAIVAVHYNAVAKIETILKQDGVPFIKVLPGSIATR